MKLLNLGCGQIFHKDWINIDFASSNTNVIAHNLLNGIPFNNNEFDVVYHSHVLEHFSRKDGKKFISECYRVLKPGGIVRVAIPDLEQIVKNYLVSMEGALAGDPLSANNYEWMMLELYDQTVRNESGGEMAKYIYQGKMENEPFVFSRIGQEEKYIKEKFLETSSSRSRVVSGYVFKQGAFLKRVFNFKLYYLKFKELFFYNEIKKLDRNKLEIEIGKFRLSGEIHQWMYDRYSLSKLLKDCGFAESQVASAFESRISEWNSYELESKGGIVRKPDSLFMEAIKK